jgi:hypothetical protein
MATEASDKVLSRDTVEAAPVQGDDIIPGTEYMRGLEKLHFGARHKSDEP